MLGNAAIVHFLEDRNVGYIFHLPGIHTLPLNAALRHSKIKVFMGRHESNLAFTADGFSRATGEAGVVLVTPGPGLGNVVTACMEAYTDDVPLVILFVDVERKDVEKGILHGVKEPETFFRNITKKIFLVSGADDLLTALETAFRAALSHRQGPVLVSIPYRCLEREVPVPCCVSGGEEETPFDPESLEKALKGSARPVIIGGGGLKGYAVRESLHALCRESAVPYLFSTGGKGVLREDNDYVLGNVATKGVARKVLSAAECDHRPGNEAQGLGYEEAGSEARPSRAPRHRRPVDRTELPAGPRHDGRYGKDRGGPLPYHERQEHVVGYGGAEEDKRAGRGPP